MVISETPKLKPHIDMMKANLQSILEIPLDRISIKATTNEMLGLLGAVKALLHKLSFLYMKERFNHEFHESSFCSKPYGPFHIGGARSALIYWFIST